MRKVKSIILILWAMALSYPVMAQANEAEKEALALIISEMQYIKQLIIDAELKKNTNAVYAFDYQALRADFNGVISGLQDYLERPSRTPAVITPLVLKYIEK